MRWLLVLLLLCPAESLEAQEPPPAYPRTGAVKVLENDDVIVWDIAWLRQAYPVHRHRYDHTGVYYSSGDRIIISTEGERRPVSTEAWNISFQLRGVTHSEEGASEEPLRAIFIQVKREPMEVEGMSGGPPVFPLGQPTERLDNERVHVWEYGPESPSPPRVRHRHVHDAVIVSFDAANRPEVHYLESGTVHDAVPTGAARTFVFEIR